MSISPAFLEGVIIILKNEQIKISLNIDVALDGNGSIHESSLRRLFKMIVYLNQRFNVRDLSWCAKCNYMSVLYLWIGMQNILGYPSLTADF